MLINPVKPFSSLKTSPKDKNLRTLRNTMLQLIEHPEHSEPRKQIIEVSGSRQLEMKEPEFHYQKIIEGFKANGVKFDESSPESQQPKRVGRTKSLEEARKEKIRVVLSDLLQVPKKKVEKIVPSRRDFYERINAERADELMERYMKGLAFHETKKSNHFEKEKKSASGELSRQNTFKTALGSKRESSAEHSTSRDLSSTVELGKEFREYMSKDVNHWLRPSTIEKEANQRAEELRIRQSAELQEFRTFLTQ